MSIESLNTSTYLPIMPGGDTTKTFARILLNTEATHFKHVSYYVANHLLSEEDKVNLTLYMNMYACDEDDDIDEDYDLLDDDDESLDDDESKKQLKNKYILSPSHYYNFTFNEINYTIVIEEKGERALRKGCEHYYFQKMYITSLMTDISYESMETNFNEFIKKAGDIYDEECINIETTDEKINVYMSSDDWWFRLSTIRKRTQNTVYLPKSKKDKIIQKIGNFLSKESKEIFRFLGIPCKLNLLFEGPPGTGKTTTIKAVASHFNFDIRIINFTPTTTDDKLMSLVRGIKTKSIVVLEDWGNMEDDVKKAVTISGRLQILDGLATRQGLVIIMTTNHKNVLDKAFFRPGRIDEIVTFEFIAKAEIQKMFINFTYVSENISISKYQTYIKNPKLTQEEIDKVVVPPQTPDSEKTEKFQLFHTEFKKLSIKIPACVLESYLRGYFNNPDEATSNIDKLKTIYDEHLINDDKKMYS
jgi:hypothetical protein